MISISHLSGSGSAAEERTTAACRGTTSCSCRSVAGAAGLRIGCLSTTPLEPDPRTIASSALDRPAPVVFGSCSQNHGAQQGKHIEDEDLTKLRGRALGAESSRLNGSLEDLAAISATPPRALERRNITDHKTLLGSKLTLKRPAHSCAARSRQTQLTWHAVGGLGALACWRGRQR